MRGWRLWRDIERILGGLGWGFGSVVFFVFGIMGLDTLSMKCAFGL